MYLIEYSKRFRINQIFKRSFTSINSHNSLDGEDGLDTSQNFPKTNEACQMPRKFRHCDNNTVFSLAILGEHGARRERLVREVMRIDNVDWETARIKVEEINRSNDSRKHLAQLPYRVGVFAGIGTLLSIPLVFHRGAVLWFAENIVNYPVEDIPKSEELETCWLVGRFAWEWMEPLIGTLSFVLLGFQFTRNHMLHIGLSPYADFLKKWRARRLVKNYPQYDKNIVMDFAATDHWNR